MKKFAFHFITLLFFAALIICTYFEHKVGPLVAFVAVVVSSIMYRVRNKKMGWVNIVLYIWIALAISSGVGDHYRYITEIIYIAISYVVAIMIYKEYDPEPKPIRPSGVEDFFKQGGGN